MAEKFNIVKRGYDPQEVDRYVEELESVVKSYKEKDAAIKNAFVNAQLAADNIIKNAEIEVGNSKLRAVAQLEKIFYSVQRQRTLVDAMRRDYEKLISEYIKQVDDRDFKPIYEQIEKLEQYLTSLKEVPQDEQHGEQPAPSTTGFTAATLNAHTQGHGAAGFGMTAGQNVSGFGTAIDSSALNALGVNSQ